MTRQPNPLLKKYIERTARAVLDALPSSYMAMEVSVDEAILIGKNLFPQWVLVHVRNPKKRTDLECLLEMLGRGLLFSAVHCLPAWMATCWYYKTDKNDESLLEKICLIVHNIDDAEKLAANWIMLACGYSEEEVIESYLCDTIDPEPSVIPKWAEDRLKAMEDA